MFIHFNIQYRFNAVLYYYVLYNNYYSIYSELKKWRREKQFFGGFQDCCYVEGRVVGVCAYASMAYIFSSTATYPSLHGIHWCTCTRYEAAEWSDAVAITKLQQELDFAYCVCMSVFVFSVQILGGQRPQDCHSSTCTAPINIRRRECNSASFSFGAPYC